MTALAADNSTIKRDVIYSIEEKIRQAVEIGSVSLAIEDNFFTTPALFKWLVTAPNNDNTQIAYKYLCTVIHPNEQYMDDGQHLLRVTPHFSAVATLMGLDFDTPSQKNAKDDPIIARICDHLSSLSVEDKRRRVMIATGEGPIVYIRNNLGIYIRAHHFIYLRETTVDEYNKHLVNCDWTAKFRYVSSLPHLILKRIAHLQKEAPIYYANVAYKAYYKVVKKLANEKLFIELSKDQLKLLDSFFPDVIDRRIFTYNDLGYRLSLMPNDIAGYILGFPIQTVIPDDVQIHQAIKFLMDKGIDGYVDYIKGYLKDIYKSSSPFSTLKSPEYSNDDDVLMEHINEYTPFDVVSYQAGSYIFRFTRPEFDKLLDTKKNPWTNEYIPLSILSEISAREAGASAMDLPPCHTLRELLERTESGKLYEPDIDDTTPSQSPTPINVNNPFGIDFSLITETIPNMNNNVELIPSVFEQEMSDEDEDDEDDNNDYFDDEIPALEYIQDYRSPQQSSQTNDTAAISQQPEQSDHTNNTQMDIPISNDTNNDRTVVSDVTNERLYSPNGHDY